MVSFFFIMGNYGQLLWARMGDWTDGACVLFVTGYVRESLHAGKFILTLVWAISMTSCFVNRSSPVCVSVCSWVGTTARSGYGRKPDG